MKFWFLLFPMFFFGWAQPALFEEFPNRFFIETGSHQGAGIEMALKAGFIEIHSIELSEMFYRECEEKFAGCLNVHLWLGDSGEMLDQVLAEIDEPATFWLDGHWSGGSTAKGVACTPILKELEAIGRHPIKTHTILIDDIRCFGTAAFDFTELAEVIERILSINPGYEISFRDGFQANDILVARVAR